MQAQLLDKDLNSSHTQLAEANLRIVEQEREIKSLRFNLAKTNEPTESNTNLRQRIEKLEEQVFDRHTKLITYERIQRVNTLEQFVPKLIMN